MVGSSSLWQGGVNKNVHAYPARIFSQISLAVRIVIPVERAADAILGVDDRPTAIDLDSFKLREIIAAAGSVGEAASAQVEADLCGEDLIVARDSNERIIGKELSDEAPEARIEGRAAAGSICKQRSSTQNEVVSQGCQILG